MDWSLMILPLLDNAIDFCHIFDLLKKICVIIIYCVVSCLIAQSILSIIYIVYIYINFLNKINDQTCVKN